MAPGTDWSVKVMVSSGEGHPVKVYGYRWVVLIVFAVITLLIELQWLTFAPIAREAKALYAVSAFEIDLLSMVFMVVYLVICVPASYVIDTHGIRIGVGIGAVLTGVFSLIKGFYATDYTMVAIAQVGLAVAQPFLLNAATKVAVRWFPIQERATAVGIATLAQFLGIVVVMVATPMLVVVGADGSSNIEQIFMIYGAVSAAGAVLVLILLRERPPTPPHAEREDDEFKFFAGIGHMLKKRDMVLLLITFFIGLGMFNAVSTCIDQICELKGLTTEQTGLVGGIMLIAGIVGAVVLPTLSDKLRKRKVFVVLAIALMTPGLIGLTLFSAYIPVLVSSFVLGFFLLGGGAPVGFQYAAEVSSPAPESTSQGLLLLSGQISGIIFIVGMNFIGVTPFMMLFIGLSIVAIVLCTRLNESPMISED